MDITPEEVYRAIHTLENKINNFSVYGEDCTPYKTKINEMDAYNEKLRNKLKVLAIDNQDLINALREEIEG